MIGKRIVLIAGIGNSPQVLTEMVWEMAHLAKPIVPDEIVALAAKSSAEKLKRELLDGGEKSLWAGLLAALKREKIDSAGKLRFGMASIAVLPDAGGNEMQDLRSGDDSLLAADFILGQLRRFTHTNDAAVMKAYGFPSDLDASDIVSRLFKMYAAMVTRRSVIVIAKLP